MPVGSLTQEDVEENLNFIEKMLSELGSEDEFMAAILYNQKLMTQALMDRDTPINGETTTIPPGTAGLAIDNISEGETGTVLFKVDGRTVLSDFRAGSEIIQDEVVRVSNTDNLVHPISDVDPAKLDFGAISTASKDSSRFIYEETSENVSIAPGDTETVVDVEVTEPAAWFETGTNDETYSLYQYVIDGDELLHEPLKKPLGLYNNMYRFPQPIQVNSKLEVRVTRQADANSPEEYFSNIILM